MVTRWQKRKSPALVDAHIDGKPAQQQTNNFGSITESAIEVPAQRDFFWQGAVRQLGQLAMRIKLALKRSQALDEGLAERDRIPW